MKLFFTRRNPNLPKTRFEWAELQRSSMVYAPIGKGRPCAVLHLRGHLLYVWAGGLFMGIARSA